MTREACHSAASARCARGTVQLACVCARACVGVCVCVCARVRSISLSQLDRFAYCTSVPVDSELVSEVKKLCYVRVSVVAR